MIDKIRPVNQDVKHVEPKEYAIEFTREILRQQSEIIESNKKLLAVISNPILIINEDRSNDNAL